MLRAAGTGFDPTIAFQRCTACDGRIGLQIRRYRCRKCGSEVVSRFLFDGLVFNAEYFRAEDGRVPGAQARAAGKGPADAGREPIGHSPARAGRP